MNKTIELNVSEIKDVRKKHQTDLDQFWPAYVYACRTGNGRSMEGQDQGRGHKGGGRTLVLRITRQWYSAFHKRLRL